MLSLSITFYWTGWLVGAGRCGSKGVERCLLRRKSLHAIRGSSGRKNGSGETPTQRRVDLSGLPKSTGLDRPAGLGTISKHLWGSERLHFRVAGCAKQPYLCDTAIQRNAATRKFARSRLPIWF
jgi:hypothetical protein